MNALDIASSGVIALSIVGLVYACGVLGMIIGSLIPRPRDDVCRLQGLCSSSSPA